MESFLPPGAAQKRGIIEEECASPSRKRLMLDASTIDRPSMCDRCRNIQWEDLAAIPPASRRGRKAADLRPVDSDALRQSNCPTCRLFAEIIPPSLDGQHCRLVALSSSLAFQGQEVRATERVDGSDCTVLYPVLEAKSADKTAGQRIQRDCQALPETGPRRISARLDTDMIKRWVRECVKRHRTCRPNVGGINDLQGFRVIDCDSRKTIEAPAGCRYVALSYNGNESQISLLTTASEQCIDQNDEIIKASQVAQMDKIYSGAYFTIVAAAGKDASYGLPGVSDRRRNSQNYISSVAGNIDIIQVFPHTSAELDKATWARRGWTYQEGYLSNRRLIFTDQQVSFLCNVAHHAETIQKAKIVAVAEMNESTYAFRHMMPCLNPNMHMDPVATKQWNELKQEQLVNYTRRDLTHESDSLNAILGLFRTLQPSGIQHLHGVPIRRTRKGDYPWLQFPLAWHHEADGATRREQFPSWSWSGWEGGIRMDESDICIPGDCEIGLAERDGRGVLALEDWFDREVRDRNPPNADDARLLCVTSLTVRVRCRRRAWAELNEGISGMSRLAGMRFTDGVHAVLPIREGVTQMAYAYMDEDVPLDDTILGLILRRSWSRKNAILLLKRDDGHPQHYRRIGLVRVSGWAKTRPAAVGDSDPQSIYVDGDGSPLEEFEHDNDALPLWLQKAVERTITIS
ncbi:uncharacterized protein PG998_013616 [Apiospora kogelbergensis]|uniref:uncharacterized protein n=1 Tax=Apiospora kogelbergensis TaxID=1337665 RepID=UPI00312E6E97